ncbi:MAG: TIGR04282 family arsenosugar biosynthesis glycosyltransferase [Gammaproteobacteria bacterium]|nr:MAG: TIGR04282 family arsenosugar biosynthesis glycosyltransferase [Gammaproteobacteria bacterium]
MASAFRDAIPVLVFTRTPVPGRVKTRLIPAIGAERAANLHRAMLWRTVATAAAAGVGPVGLWCSPSSAHPYIAEIQRAFGVDAHVQRGADLGERMHLALRSQRDGAGGALLVGTDCPFLEARDLQLAARALREGADAVIGPAQDGGYYLIGVRKSDLEVFTGVAWGTEQVLAATRQKLRDLGWRWRELATRRDVDRPADLEAVADLLVY